MLLTEYDIQYVTPKTVKGSVLYNYLAHHPVEGYQPMRFNIPDENILLIRDYEISGPDEGPKPGSRWTLVFNGALNVQGHGIGEIITSPSGFHLPFTTRLYFDCTNNIAEHKTCISANESTIDMRIKMLEVYGDSTLVISQIKGDWETRDSKLIPYKKHVIKLIPCFDEITFYHIPREENQLADALASLTYMFKVKLKNEAPFIQIEHMDEPPYCLATKAESDDQPWFYDIKRYL